MACCAAAVFFICQFIYGVRRLIGLMSGGRWLADSAPQRSASAAWRLHPTTAEGSLPVAKGARGMSHANLTSLGTTMLLLGGATGFWFLTKPGISSPLPEVAFMTKVHQSICGQTLNATR